MSVCRKVAQPEARIEDFVRNLSGLLHYLERGSVIGRVARQVLKQRTIICLFEGPVLLNVPPLIDTKSDQHA